MFSPVCTGSGSIGQSQRCSSLASCGQCSGADLRRTERRSAQRVASEVARQTVRAMTYSPVLELGGGLLALVNGGASLRLGLAALDEVLGVEEPAKLLIEPGERRRLGLVDREVRGLQRGLD